MLYANTVERAAMPTHLPDDGRYSAGTFFSASSPGEVNRPAFSTADIDGEFSVRNTSAGERSPSWISCCDISVSSPLRTWTLMPVAFVKASIQLWVSSSCWAL